MLNINIDPTEIANSLIKEQYDLNIKKEQSYQLENQCAVKIQRVLKGFTVRRRIKKLNQVMIIIQRNVRGFIQRRRYARLLASSLEAQRQDTFSFYALVIQRHFRGYQSRKHIHNFTQRKKQLAKVVEKNQRVLASVQAEAERQQRQYEIDEENKAQREFASQVSNMHHLVGTHQINSVFNNPQEPLEHRTKICGIAIEDHIKLQFKSSYGTKKKVIRHELKGTGTLERF